MASAATPAMEMHASGSMVSSLMAMRPYTLRSSFASKKSVCAVPRPKDHPRDGRPKHVPDEEVRGFVLRDARAVLGVDAREPVDGHRSPGAVEPTASTASELPPMRYEPKAPQSPGSVAPTINASREVESVTATMKLKSLASEGRPIELASLMPICAISPGNTLRR